MAVRIIKDSNKKKTDLFPSLLQMWMRIRV